jgi:anti-anti-sigma regulatory factor
MVLRGSLKGLWVNELEHAWMTATSILKGKDFVIDISGLTGIDISGLQLLSRIRAAGGRLTGEPPT